MTGGPGRRIWVHAPEAVPPSIRDRVLLLLAVLGIAFALTHRAALEPRLADGILVEVTGSVTRPGIHLVRRADAASAVAAARGTPGTPPMPIREGDRLRVNAESLVVDVMEDPLLAARPVDVNRATPASLASLPGVGPSLASAIVERRDRAGPFYGVEDLRGVRGIGSSKLRALEPLLTVGAVGPRPEPPPFDLQTASAADFEKLPGIGPVLAARIVADRAAYGPFASLEDLARVPGVGPRTVERVREVIGAR